MKLLKKIVKIPQKIISKIKREYLKYKNANKINELLEELKKENKPTIIFFNVVDWNIPLFQRPQHIARCMSEEGFNYLFFTGNVYDNIKIYEKDRKNLYLINAAYLKDVINNLKVKNKYIQLYSTDMKTKNQDIDIFKSKGYQIIYEYIDEISADLYGKAIPKSGWEKHSRLLKDKDVFIVCTARKLYNQAFNIRGEVKLKLITNGVDYSHFQSGNKEQCLISSIVKKNQPIIGYFGAFANWFDYEMIETLAIERPNYQILLIGWRYDESIKSSPLNKLKNVTIIGPIDYEMLPQYGQWFDIATIPFKLNEITESTSPIKLFEYMALGKPIVTSNMPECRLYSEVLIAKNKEEFIMQVDCALSLVDDHSYLNKLKKQALMNTWESKAKDIVKLLQEERM